MTREDISAIRQELKGVKSLLETLLSTDSTGSTSTATSGNQVITNNLLTAIEANTSTGSNPNGQATMANSAPVVIASNQTAIPISATTLPLPSGAATSGGITTLNTNISNMRNVELANINISLNEIKVSAQTYISETVWHKKDLPNALTSPALDYYIRRSKYVDLVVGTAVDWYTIDGTLVDVSGFINTLIH